MSDSTSSLLLSKSTVNFSGNRSTNSRATLLTRSGRTLPKSSLALHVELFSFPHNHRSLILMLHFPLSFIIYVPMTLRKVMLFKSLLSYIVIFIYSSRLCARLLLSDMQGMVPFIFLFSIFSHPNFLRLKSITLAPARVILFSASTLLILLSHFIT